MAVPFPDIDPYEELEVTKDDAPPIIKKAYYKLCLKYHPDKLNKSDKIKHKSKFEKIQFSYSILSDSTKRSRYDRTGSLEEVSAGGEADEFDWGEFFNDMKNTDFNITSDLIEKDKKDYQNGDEEFEDILESMIFYRGDFIKLFEVIPHLEFTESEESRIFKIVEKMVDDKLLKDYKSWQLYIKNRSRIIKKSLNKLNTESKEAEILLQEINEKNKIKLNGSENSLKQLIQSRNQKNNSSFDKLLSKYGGDSLGDGNPLSVVAKGKKSGKKRKEYDLDDDEFERIQQEMLSKSKKGKKT